MQCVVAFPALTSCLWLEIAGGKRERSMTWNHRQVLLKCMFLLKLLNHTFYMCSINEHERWNTLSFIAVLPERLQPHSVQLNIYFGKKLNFHAGLYGNFTCLLFV
jgi:hypothetical protein